MLFRSFLRIWCDGAYWPVAPVADTAVSVALPGGEARFRGRAQRQVLPRLRPLGEPPAGAEGLYPLEALCWIRSWAAARPRRLRPVSGGTLPDAKYNRGALYERRRVTLGMSW